MQQGYAAPLSQLQTLNAATQQTQKQQTGRHSADVDGQTAPGQALKADMHRERATLEQQWEGQQQSRLLQADQWSHTDVQQFMKAVRLLHTKGKGQAVPDASDILDRLCFFPSGAQGYEALGGQLGQIIKKGGSEFGGIVGFAMLIRGPEQYLTKGPGYIYVYYVKDAPKEYKVGMCKDLPERRVSGDKLVGRVVDQRKHNNKEYLLSESFAVPHRTLVDEILKVRLKQWNYCHPGKGDGYTEWFRHITLDDLKDHIRDVIQVVTALYT